MSLDNEYPEIGGALQVADFVHLQRDNVYVGGRVLTRESLIFPRYHQLDVVRRLLTDVRTNGMGRNYLIQHSAGSGKSNSIAWLAHSLSNLHDTQGRDIVFHSVVVVTDRRVLDRQLQETIFQFQHQQGIVIKIEDDSQQLLDALRLGAKIIVTTLQKIPFVVDEIANVGYLYVPVLHLLLGLAQLPYANYAFHPAALDVAFIFL